jgi:hypothetical protein
MVDIKKSDLDLACGAYARATGDYPRREGIRVALHSFRQMTDRERDLMRALIEDLETSGRSNMRAFGVTAHEFEMAETLKRLLGLP